MKNAYLHICIGIFAILAMTITGCDSGGSSSGGGFTISGTITAPGSTAIDSDVNEINVIPISNNTFDTAQKLNKNPVILGGYTNIKQTGEDGNSYANGDETDIFIIHLTKNETINLYIAEYETADADIDLYLYDDNDTENFVDSSTGDNAVESVQATSAGPYYIKVAAVSNATNYVLTIGQGITGGTILDADIEDDFMPGDIVVKLRPGTQAAFGSSDRSFKNTILGLHYTSGNFDSEMVLKLDPENRQQVFSALNITPTEYNQQLFQTDAPEDQLKLDTLRAIYALKKRPEVMFAEPNYLRQAMGEPDDEYYPMQWHYPLIHLPQAWEVWESLEASTGTSEVIVAVIDTGILSNHPDIDPDSLVDGYDFISKTSISLDGDGMDSNPEDPGDDLEGRSSFHGTHVAGTIGAATNNATGVAGIARNCKIMPLRVLGNGGGLASDIRQAIYYAAGLSYKSGPVPSKRADIINLSLGGSSYSDLDQQAIYDARAEGVIIIAAAGNYASSDPMYPAAYEGVISVSSVGADKQLAPYSNYGPTIDIAAPGGNKSRDYDGDGQLDGVWSTGGNDATGSIQMVYNLKQGTSMAAPHVAGVIALMKSILPTLSPDNIDDYIEGKTGIPITEDLGLPGPDNSYGHGLIDAFEAVRAVSDELPTFLFASPLSLNFGTSETTLTLTAQNFGSEDIPLVTPNEEESWLTIVEVVDPVDPVDQRWTYEVTVVRDGLVDGPYAATFTLDYEIDFVPKQAQISVNMQKGIPTGGDAGYHYVLLLDPDTFTTVAQYDVPVPVNGIYSFSLSARAGDYILFAGTDSDNDYMVGDPGESAGAYISMDQPRVIRLNRDRSGYNFTTSFNINLPTMLTGEEDEYGWAMQEGNGFQIVKP